MSRKTNPVQLLWHIVRAIHEVSEVVTALQTENYPDAIHHAIRTAWHLGSLVMARKTIQTEGKKLSAHIKRLGTHLIQQLRHRLRSLLSRNDDNR